MNCELMLTYDTPAYMFNVYKNQPSRQTGRRNLMGPKNAYHDMGYLYEACDQTRCCTLRRAKNSPPTRSFVSNLIYTKAAMNNSRNFYF